MKKGFTLAEVLITLAVIGVVAALTIPVLVQKYQKKQLYSQFMKTYNTIVNAMDNAVADHGEPINWNWGETRYNYETGDEEFVSEGDKPFENYILPYMKYIKKCDEAKDCFASGYTYLNGSDGNYSGYVTNYYTGEVEYFSYDEYTLDNQLGNFKDAVVLADGSSLFVVGEKCWMTFVFDTNGKKGPNVMGRDLFAIEYNSGCWGDSEGFDIEEYRDGSGTDSYGYSRESNCSTSGDSWYGNSDGCVSRLLQEGAMNY